MRDINNEAKIRKEYLEKLKDQIYNFVNRNIELDLERLNKIRIENTSSDGKF